MVCKGICIRYKVKKPVQRGRYSSGQKKCQYCDIWMMTEKTNCPCCGLKLRTKPRNKRYKELLRQIKLETHVK